MEFISVLFRSTAGYSAKLDIVGEAVGHAGENAEAVDLLLVVEAELDDVGLRVVRRAAGEVITVVLTPGDGGAVRILGVVRRVGNAEAEAGATRREGGGVGRARCGEEGGI